MNSTRQGSPGVAGAQDAALQHGAQRIQRLQAGAGEVGARLLAGNREAAKVCCRAASLLGPALVPKAWPAHHDEQQQGQHVRNLVAHQHVLCTEACMPRNRQVGGG